MDKVKLYQLINIKISFQLFFYYFLLYFLLQMFKWKIFLFKTIFLIHFSKHFSSLNFSPSIFFSNFSSTSFLFLNSIKFWFQFRPRNLIFDFYFQNCFWCQILFANSFFFRIFYIYFFQDFLYFFITIVSS